MNTDEIKGILPHRPPFLFVDEVLEIDDKRIVAKRNIRADEYFFAGHFPEEPIMPGVLVVASQTILSFTFATPEIFTIPPRSCNIFTSIISVSPGRIIFLNLPNLQ